ncbi:MAG: TonB-dependent receptor [Bacteroidales bacterium]|nr:TonB-dependent receptor [Bacteroidales bacterium]
MKKNALYFLLGLSSFFPISLAAQTAQDSIIRRDLLLEKEYNPMLETAGKIYRVPETEDLKTKETEVRFSVSEAPTMTPGEYVPLRAAEARTYFPAREQKAYVRLGGGYHWAALGDAQWNILRGPRHLLDLTAWHRSSFGKLILQPDLASRAKHVDSRLGLNYQWHLNSAEFRAGLSERFYAWNYYGRSWSNLPFQNRDSLVVPGMQWFSDTKLSLGIESKPWDKAFDYAFNVDAHYFRLGKALAKDSLAGAGTAETELDANLALNHQINDKLAVGLDGRLRTLFYQRAKASQRISLADHMQYDPSFVAFSDVPANAFWFELNPQAKYSLGLWDFGLGFRLSYLGGQKLLIAPTASVNRPLGDWAKFNFELDGGQKLYSYREGLELNSYLDPSIRLLPEYTPVALRGALQIKPLSGLNMTAFTGYSFTRDLAMFYNALPADSGMLNNLSYSRLFMANYVKMNKLYVGLGFNFAYRKTLNLSGKASYNHYIASSSDLKMDMLLSSNARRPWHKPAFEAEALLNFTPTEQTAFFVSYHWEGTRYAPDYFTAYRRLPDIHYLSLGGSYDITRRLGVFLHLNNVLNQFYEVWNAYPSQGFTAVVGASYSF